MRPSITKRPSITHFAAVLLIALFAACLAAPLGAESEGTSEAAAEALRAKLAQPSPAITYDYKGDLVVGGLWAGEARYTARAAKVGRQAVWRVTEDTYVDFAGAETRVRLLVHLKADLSILSGTYERTEKGGATKLAFSRSGDQLMVQRRIEVEGSDAKTDLVLVPAAKNVSTGLGSLLLFSRALPEKTGPSKSGAAYTLPWISGTTWNTLSSSSRASPLVLKVSGASTFPIGKETRKTWALTYEHGGKHITCHLSPDRRSLVSLVQAPANDSSTSPLQVVPRGEGGERLTVDADKPASTWKEAFLKFGFGYHLPRRRLLEASFHWEDMYEHETTVLKRWDPAQPLEDFKTAWVEEFVKQSKNRSVQDARRLLSMTLGTGTLKKNTKDEVIFAAHANFGGGVQRTYYLRQRDGIWGITRIDF